MNMQTKNTHQIMRWKHFDSIASLRHSVYEVIEKSAKEAIVKRGQFSIVLARGRMV